MLHLEVKAKEGKYLLTLPTDMKEISNEYLSAVTKHVNVAPEYSLVAVVYREKLAIVLNNAKQQKEINASVVPVFVKAGDTENKFVKKGKLGDLLIVSGSDLAIGYHINSALNELSLTNIVNVCNIDDSVYRTVLTNTQNVYFVEFKIIPNSAIKAVLDEITVNVKQPYVAYVSNKE